ncbi:hypothetical protein [Tahibacter sp.]|uniref:hypothetical protein n=1 Tax=Tahibacter sp. TaxID=2056211 RepID=UPI0028C4C5CF|nr:hypothetical protein [Tahibacter sp.]
MLLYVILAFFFSMIATSLFAAVWLSELRARLRQIASEHEAAVGSAPGWFGREPEILRRSLVFAPPPELLEHPRIAALLTRLRWKWAVPILWGVLFIAASIFDRG